VDGNISVKGLASGELAGGTDFPACLVPVASASEIVGRAGKRDLRTAAGLPLPPIDSSPDRGALAAGSVPWRPGHEAWPGRPAPPTQVVAKPQPTAVPPAADPAARSSVTPATTPTPDPANAPQPAAAAESSSMPILLGLLGAVAVIAVIVLLANRRPAGHRGHRR
jgi:hypothetical protein